MNVGAGEFVRTIYGEIFKVVEPIKQTENYILVDEVVDRSIDRDCNDNWLKIGEITKHSKNIIDIIEVRGLCKWGKNNNCWQKMVIRIR